MHFINRKKFFKLILFLLGMMIFPVRNPAQKPIPEMTAASYSAEQVNALEAKFGKRKTIPPAYKKQILIALSYFPELEKANIVFRIKQDYTPLSSRPSWASVFRHHKNREYIITISDESSPELNPILLDKMDFNAQVGVLGHEISHVVDFSHKNTAGLLRIGLGNLSTSFLDKFEYATDSICIAHGLGYQLLSWSLFVRKAFRSPNWDGADSIKQGIMKRERYMNPETIRKRLNIHQLYQGSF